MDFLGELRAQPEALRTLLDRCSAPGAFQEAYYLRPRPRAVVFAGMGASLFACLPAAAYLAEHGLPAYVLDAGELLNLGWPALLRGTTLLVLVSQSGESYEVVSLAELLLARRTRPRIFAVTNAPESALARLADCTMLLHAGVEEGTSSKTYVNSLALLLLLAAVIAQASLGAALRRMQPLPDHLAGLVARGSELSDDLADFLAVGSYLPIVARGPSLASALDGALVLKEAAAIGAEAFSAGAFRHGPFEMVGADLRAIILAGGRTGVLNQRLADEMATRGARVVLLAAPDLPPASPTPRLLPIALPPAPEFEAPILEIVPLQFLALTLGRRQGRDPGTLHVGGKIVRTAW